MAIETWQEELRGCVRSLDELGRLLPRLDLVMARAAIGRQRLAITPHTLRLIDWSDPRDPLLLMSTPDLGELDTRPEELDDPIGDAARSPIPFLTHRYPDRVLIHATYACAQYCRFCFRRAKTGHATLGPNDAERGRIIDYLRAHPTVDEVILSGGDPWTLVDAQITAWLDAIRGVSSVRRIRFHTRIPVVLPSRVTDALVETLRRHQAPERPIIVVTHFNHPRELAEANVTALAKLADAGIALRNQNVLLRGVNDDAATLATLYKRLVDCRVVPYYLHQLDLAVGTNRFRVPIDRGLEIMRELQGRVTGLALPRYMLDLPGGKGKIPLQHAYLRRQPGGGWQAESPFGELVDYRDPAG